MSQNSETKENLSLENSQHFSLAGMWNPEWNEAGDEDGKVNCGEIKKFSGSPSQEARLYLRAVVSGRRVLSKGVIW